MLQPSHLTSPCIIAAIVNHYKDTKGRPKNKIQGLLDLQDLLPIFNCFSLHCLTQSSTGRRSSLLRERSTLEEPVDKLEANKKGEEKEPFYG